ncbi:uncharacterized protein LOC129906411 [Episyrphus balteatus]|uniref:uncharacterized protein LOC129906411 n=1 Tax=Episyrphus balteatus TaxID=286459 RepID=UPI0024861C01|nr:uncharacterized protein LOC129906411 [Episyrphus balteatus]
MNFKPIWILLLITGIQCAEKDTRILSRKRRFLSFPEGSSFAASICMTIGVIGNPVLEYMSWAVNWGIAYDLPNQTWVRQHKHGFSNSLDAHNTKVRYRRDLYEGIELAMDSMGFNGRDCISRTLCESSNFLKDRSGNMVEEIVKLIFSFPRHKGALYHHNNGDNMHHYDKAYYNNNNNGDLNYDCQQKYPNCHFSLLELALGNAKYSLEPTKHGTAGFM